MWTNNESRWKTPRTMRIQLSLYIFIYEAIVDQQWIVAVFTRTHTAFHRAPCVLTCRQQSTTRRTLGDSTTSTKITKSRPMANGHLSKTNQNRILFPFILTVNKIWKYVSAANSDTRFIRLTNSDMMHVKYATINNLQPITIRKNQNMWANYS